MKILPNYIIEYMPELEEAIEEVRLSVIDHAYDMLKCLDIDELSSDEIRHKLELYDIKVEDMTDNWLPNGRFYRMYPSIKYNRTRQNALYSIAKSGGQFEGVWSTGFAKKSEYNFRSIQVLRHYELASDMDGYFYISGNAARHSDSHVISSASMALQSDILMAQALPAGYTYLYIPWPRPMYPGDSTYFYNVNMLAFDRLTFVEDCDLKNIPKTSKMYNGKYPASMTYDWENGTNTPWRTPYWFNYHYMNNLEHIESDGRSISWPISESGKYYYYEIDDSLVEIDRSETAPYSLLHTPEVYEPAQKELYDTKSVFPTNCHTHGRYRTSEPNRNQNFLFNKHCSEDRLILNSYDEDYENYVAVAIATLCSYTSLDDALSLMHNLPAEIPYNTNLYPTIEEAYNFLIDSTNEVNVVLGGLKEDGMFINLVSVIKNVLKYTESDATSFATRIANGEQVTMIAPHGVSADSIVEEFSPFCDIVETEDISYGVQAEIVYGIKDRLELISYDESFEDEVSSVVSTLCQLESWDSALPIIRHAPVEIHFDTTVYPTVEQAFDFANKACYELKTRLSGLKDDSMFANLVSTIERVFNRTEIAATTLANRIANDEIVTLLLSFPHTQKFIKKEFSPFCEVVEVEVVYYGLFKITRNTDTIDENHFIDNTDEISKEPGPYRWDVLSSDALVESDKFHHINTYKPFWNEKTPFFDMSQQNIDLHQYDTYKIYLASYDHSRQLDLRSALLELTDLSDTVVDNTISRIPCKLYGVYTLDRVNQISNALSVIDCVTYYELASTRYLHKDDSLLLVGFENEAHSKVTLIKAIRDVYAIDLLSAKRIVESSPVELDIPNGYTEATFIAVIEENCGAVNIVENLDCLSTSMIMTSYGSQKMNVIHELRNCFSDLTLAAAKALCDNVPSLLPLDLAKDTLSNIKIALEAKGATIILNQTRKIAASLYDWMNLKQTENRPSIPFEASASDEYDSYTKALIKNNEPPISEDTFTSYDRPTVGKLDPIYIGYTRAENNHQGDDETFGNDLRSAKSLYAYDSNDNEEYDPELSYNLVLKYKDDAPYYDGEEANAFYDSKAYIEGDPATGKLYVNLNEIDLDNNINRLYNYVTYKKLRTHRLWFSKDKRNTLLHEFHNYLYKAKSQVPADEGGIVFSTSVNVYDRPLSIGTNIVRTLSHGATFTVYDYSAGWLKISENSSEWIHSRYTNFGVNELYKCESNSILSSLAYDIIGIYDEDGNKIDCNVARMLLFTNDESGTTNYELVCDAHNIEQTVKASVDLNNGSWSSLDDTQDDLYISGLLGGDLSSFTLYKSISNYHIRNTTATMSVEIYTPTSATLNIKLMGCGEVPSTSHNITSGWDYPLFKLYDEDDNLLSNQNLYWSGTTVQNAPVQNYAQWNSFTLELPKKGNYRLEVSYRKDGSRDYGLDRAYFAIENSFLNRDGIQYNQIEAAYIDFTVRRLNCEPANDTAIYLPQELGDGLWDPSSHELYPKYMAARELVYGDEENWWLPRNEYINRGYSFKQTSESINDTPVAIAHKTTMIEIVNLGTIE